MVVELVAAVRCVDKGGEGQRAHSAKRASMAWPPQMCSGGAPLEEQITACGVPQPSRASQRALFVVIPLMRVAVAFGSSADRLLCIGRSTMSMNATCMAAQLTTTDVP